MAWSVAIAGLAVAIASVILTWYLWRRSGPEIVVVVTSVRGQWTGAGLLDGIEVVNSGRMPAVIREA